MKNTKALFTAVLAAVLVVLGSGTAFAEGAAAGYGDRGWIAIAAALTIAGAAIGAAIGQGRAVSTAMESIGRNPNAADRIQTPMILGLAFIEALAIYALVIAFLLQGKI